MSLESFTINSLGDDFLVSLMTENLEKTVPYKYTYKRCIAVIELTFRAENLERAYHELGQLPIKSTHYDEEKQQFVDSGRILIRTKLFDFTVYQESNRSVRIKKHSTNNPFALPFEEKDATQICEALTAHYIKVPQTFEIDLMSKITEGKQKQLSETVSYPPEDGLIANVAEKVNHSIWEIFHKQH